MEKKENEKLKEPGCCEECQYWYEFKRQNGLGICLSKKELREGCDCDDIMKGKSKGIERQSSLCVSCVYSYPICNSSPKFLIDHHQIEKKSIIQKDTDIVYSCDGY